MATSTTRAQQAAITRSNRNRPLARLETSAFDPTGEAMLADVLAPVPNAWSAEPGSEASSLAELSGRAAIQIATLRTALDEAARLDRAAGTRTLELAQRLEQGARFEREMDRRLEAAGRAGHVLDHAAAALVGLEKVIAELHGARNGAEEAMSRQIEAMQVRFEQRLAEAEAKASAMVEQHRLTLEMTLAQHAEAIALRLGEVSDQASRAMDSARLSADAAESEVLRITSQIEHGVKAETDRLEATMERHAAAMQARVCVLLDGAAQRVDELERTAARVGVASSERVEKACDRAAAVLGYDPRRAWGDESPVKPVGNSLADLTQRAEAAAHTADQAVIRLGVATERASEIEAKMTEVIGRVGELKTAEQLIAETTDAELRLAALRDDLESTATSVRFNLSQAQEAELILGKTIDRARDKVQGLDRAMDQVTDQAQSMVSVARDVAGLVLRAEQARVGLAEMVGSVEAASDVPRTVGKVRGDDGEESAAAA